MGAVIVELAARKYALPYECPCCGAPPDTELRVSAKTSRHSQEFPYCQRCVTHLRKWDDSGVASAGLMVLAITGAIAAAVAGSILIALGIFVAGASLAWWLRSARRAAARAGCGESCATPGHAVSYLGWSGATSSFSFASPTF